MYLPAHFEETRIDLLHRLVREHPLGSLVRSGPNGLDADSLPFELDSASGARGTLRAHVARSNPLWREIHDGTPVLVIFQGPQAYVSPNWYPSKHESHEQVPTWNYQIVHVHGRIAIRDDEKFVRGVVGRLTRFHEARTGDARPWKMSDSAPEYLSERLAAVVGLEVQIERIVGKFKLSQNKEDRDRLNAAEELDRRGRTDLARAMRDAGKT